MNKMRQWTLLTAVAVVVVLAGGWFLLVSPQKSKVSDLRAQADAQQQANTTLQSKIAQLQQQKKGLPEQQKQLAEFATKVPDNPALPLLIRQLSAAADGAGVDLVSMAPSPPQPVTAATASAVTPAAAAAPAALEQIQLTLSVKGSYYNVTSYFRSLENLSRAMKVQGWTLAPVTGGSSGASSGGAASADSAAVDPPGTLLGNLTAVVYEAPAGAAPASTTPVAAAPAQ